MLAVVLGGCVRHPQVQSKQLPVQRVVVYRNGVAYFERGGQVESENVHFQLRQENVGDFLASLAVLERGGHTVRAASFPVQLEKEEEFRPDPQLRQALDRWDGKKKDARELRRVTLELDGKEHDLRVGYLAETPLWRPSYRLVVGKGGSAILQAWGIVQNQSGEDWRDVEIALVAGAPIAFESTLGDPVIPRRPIVTDSGEVIAYVPEAKTTYQQLAEPSEEAEAEAKEDTDDEMAEIASSGAVRSKAMPASRPAPVAAADGYGYSMEDEPLGRGAFAPAQEAQMMTPAAGSASLSRVELQTGATRYEVPHRVTIPDQSATMVLLVSKKVPGEAVYLYSPEGGVPDSYAHPFRVARFKNESGGMLERGPIAVFEEGAFLGQGVLSSMPTHAQATVPFALMRSLSIVRRVNHDQRGARLYAIRLGEITVERDQATMTEYQVQNGDEESARLLVRHPRTPGSELWEPPQGTEELAKENAALIPVDVPAFAKASLMVEERRPVRRTVGSRSMEARTAIREFLKTPQLPPEQRVALETMLKHAAQLATLDDQERRLVREQRELQKSTKETRASLRAIEKNTQAAGLRAELTKRLLEGTRRLDVLTKELVELQLRRTEQEVRLKEALQGVVIEPPDQRPAD